MLRGEIWGLHAEDDAWRARRLLRVGNALEVRSTVGTITAFANDTDGELYVLTRGGRIGRLVPRREAVRYWTSGR